MLLITAYPRLNGRINYVLRATICELIFVYLIDVQPHLDRHTNLVTQYCVCVCVCVFPGVRICVCVCVCECIKNVYTCMFNEPICV